VRRIVPATGGLAPPAGSAHELRSRRCAIPPGVDTHVGCLGGGSGGRHSQGAVLVGALHVTFCAGGGAESAPRRPVPQRRSSTLARQDHRRVVPSGLTSRNFPSFGAET
jgi:hypothetical protein